MRILVHESGSHIDAAALQRDLPMLEIVSAKTHAEALELGAEAEAIIALAHEVEDDLIEAMPRLRYICALTTGVEPLVGLKRLTADTIVTNGRGMHGPQMSELAFLYMIALSRDFKAMLANAEKGLWQRWPQRLVYRKTMCIVGIGTIAEELAMRCKAFGMETIGISDARASAPGFDRIVPRAELGDAAAQADFLVVLVPLSTQTRHIIDASVLDRMKKTAIVINIARGPVVDQAALTERLLDGRLGGAGLDVFETEPLPVDNPLWRLPNVIVTPRIGGMSDTYAEQIHPLVVHNLRAFAAGRLDDMRNVTKVR